MHSTYDTAPGWQAEGGIKFADWHQEQPKSTSPLRARQSAPCPVACSTTPCPWTCPITLSDAISELLADLCEVTT